MTESTGISRKRTGQPSDAPGSVARRERPVSAPPGSTSAWMPPVFEQVCEAVVGLSIERRIVAWNATAARLFGYSAAAITDQPFALLDEPLLQDSPGVALPSNVLTQVLETQEPTTRNLACRCADGAQRIVTASFSPVRDPAGRPLGVILIGRDMTEQRRSEEALRASNRRRNEFLTIMSHELRTPLTAILGYTDLLRRGVAGVMPPRVEAYVGNVRNAALHLLDLVNGLLDYSRLESGTEVVHPRRVYLSEVMQRALDRVHASAEAKQLHLEATVDPRAAHAVADSAKLLQIFHNFLSNAVKFTPPGGSVRISVSDDPEDAGMVRVTVSDTGVGLTPEQIERVWDGFYQVDASLTRQTGGIGLGLAIVRHLASLQGGRVGAASDGPGAGSRFWLAVPRTTRPAVTEPPLS